MKTSAHLTRRASARQRGAFKGFTLIEMLVAVIAVSLLTVGIVQVFRATTRTVAAGRKISNILTYSNILERQLREDIDRMSRQGVLVIRHANAGIPGAPGTPNVGVQVFRGDTKARARRVDELVFFAEGRFTSVRDPVNPNVTAKAAAARIYYGHGLRQDPSASFATPPSLTDDNSTAPNFGNGVNQFASDWILARHVTLLAPPRPINLRIQDPANPTNFITLQGDDRDSAIQIGQQPAAPHVFLGVSVATNVGGAASLRSGELGGQRPNFASGLVDIASCSLADIRTFTLSPLDARLPGSSDAPLRGAPEAKVGGSAAEIDQGLQRVRTKLVDLLPAQSFANRRIRVEPAPPNPLGIGFPTAITDVQRTDQRVLASHAFIPHCTEFIVEWSFGQSISSSSFVSTAIAPDQVNQLRWYGMTRTVNGAGGQPSEVLPYDSDYASGISTALFFKTVTPVISTGTAPTGARPLTVRYFPDYRMFEANAGATDESYSFFGLLDPTWPPEEMTFRAPATQPTNAVLMRFIPNNVPFNFVDLSDPNAEVDGAEFTGAATPVTTPDPYAILSRDVNFNGAYEPSIGERLNYPATLPWKWPRLLRITVTLADPIDPTFERTFQYIFDLPPDPTAERN